MRVDLVNYSLVNQTSHRVPSYKSIMCSDSKINKYHSETFKGRTGGVLGALTGEMLALSIIEFCNIRGVFLNVAGFIGCCAGLGFLGSYIEDKISSKYNRNGEIKNNK